MVGIPHICKGTAHVNNNPAAEEILCAVPCQGNIVAASPAFAHRLPTVFSQPDAFQPERYAPPREEDKVKPFSYIGFGGGRHGCLGQNFAYLQVKVRADSQPLPQLCLNAAR